MNWVLLLENIIFKGVDCCRLDNVVLLKAFFSLLAIE